MYGAYSSRGGNEKARGRRQRRVTDEEIEGSLGIKARETLPDLDIEVGAGHDTRYTKYTLFQLRQATVLTALYNHLQKN